MPVSVRPGSASGADRFQSLYQLLAALSRARALEDVYDAALTSLLAATAADRAAILLFDSAGVIRFKASRGLSAEYQAAVTGQRHGPRERRTRIPSWCRIFCEKRVSPSTGTFWCVKAFARWRSYLWRSTLACSASACSTIPSRTSAGDELEIAQAIAAHVALATDHKRAELECIRSERRLRAILDNSASVIFLKDLRGRYLLVNRRYEEVFHVNKEEVVGHTDQDIFPRGVAGQFQANDRAVLAAGMPMTMEEYAPHDDGMHTYVSMKVPLRKSPMALSPASAGSQPTSRSESGSRSPASSWRRSWRAQTTPLSARI